MDLRINNTDLQNIRKDNKNNPNNFIENKNEKNSPEDDVYFYVMTLQADGERHQIKIFENSDASELAFNFCKTYNLDFPTMKYLKKCIKQIIINFNNARKNEMIYLLKDNSSIQEVAEEEIITDNSLKKSGTIKKNNSNTLNTNNDENSKSKNKSTDKNFKIDEINDNSVKKEKEVFQDFEEIKNHKNKEIEDLKLKNKLEDDGQIELKDYSIDYCLENDSIEVFPPTEHTTKIEQRSSIKNSSSLNQNRNFENNHEKKKNSKNNKLQINNNTFNRINKKQNCLFNLNKSKREKNKTNDINNNELKNILIQYKEINSKVKKSISKSKSKSKSRSKEKRFDDKNIIKKNNIRQFNKKPKSLEKMKKKSNNKTALLDNKNKEIIKKHKNNYKINKYEKFLTNMNEIKNKYYSNYYDYFLKSKNFNNTLTKNSVGHKFQTSTSINQESNRSGSISHQKNNNMSQKISMRNNAKKEKSMIELNTLNSLNHQKVNTASKFNLNTILKKDNNSKEKQKTVFKNKIKPKYNIICNSNNNFFNKTINGRCHTSRTKIKNINGQELFMESKKIKSNGIKKMVTESLLNIHRTKDPSLEKRKNTNINSRVIKALNNKSKYNKNSRKKEQFFRNETNIESSVNLYEQIYNESSNNNNATTKRRNITDANLIHKKKSFRSDCKKIAKFN